MIIGMDDVQQELFGGFPRAVGVSPDFRQFTVESISGMDKFIEAVEGTRNIYSSLSRFKPVMGDDGFEGCVVECDKVSYDLDAHGAVEAQFPRVDDQEKLRMMSTGEVSPESVLGEVCSDARRLTRASMEEGIPIIGVFSGFGLHIHQLHEPEEAPEEAMGSVARKYAVENDLGSVDECPIGDEQRVLRVPNCRRVTGEKCPCEYWTVPLSGEELLSVGPEELVDLASSGPREIDVDSLGERPEMEIEEDYQFVREDETEAKSVEREFAEVEESRRFHFRKLFPMPCVHERIVQPSPEHPVRYQMGAMLKNIGYSIEEAFSVMAEMGWKDFDPEVTRKQLRSIWKSNKGEKGCTTMQRHGLCRRSENKRSCPTYGWEGGKGELV